MQQRLNIDMDNFANRVKSRRKALGLTQEELAKASGLKQPDISKIERGLIFQTVSILDLATALRCNPAWLAKGDDYVQRTLAATGFEPVIFYDDGQVLDLQQERLIVHEPLKMLASGAQSATNFVANAEFAGKPRHIKLTPVVGTAKMGDNGYYEALDYPTGQGDGWVDNYSPDPNAYALRVKGDSMHPAIRHGSFVVVEPNGRCMPGEFVAIVLIDGRKMVKELVIEREHEIVIESVNGNHRQTLERSEIEKMHPIAAVVAASKWRQG